MFPVLLFTPAISVQSVAMEVNAPVVPAAAPAAATQAEKTLLKPVQLAPVEPTSAKPIESVEQSADVETALELELSATEESSEVPVEESSEPSSAEDSTSQATPAQNSSPTSESTPAVTALEETSTIVNENPGGISFGTWEALDFDTRKKIRLSLLNSRLAQLAAVRQNSRPQPVAAQLAPPSVQVPAQLAALLPKESTSEALPASSNTAEPAPSSPIATFQVPTSISSDVFLTHFNLDPNVYLGRMMLDGSIAYDTPRSVPTAPSYEVNGQKFLYPLPSIVEVTSEFGFRTHPISGYQKFHAGIDFGADYGTPALSAMDGVVVYAGWMEGYGNAVIVQHQYYGQPVRTLYGHLAEVNVQEGMQIAAGTAIGKVGSTGYSTGPHLHFELQHINENKDWVAIDPSPQINWAVSNYRRYALLNR